VKRTFLSHLNARNHARPEDSGPSNSWRLLLICNFPGLRAFLVAAILLVLPGLVSAQGIPVSPRVSDRVDETRLAVLQGNTHPLARAQFDQGAAPPNLPMNRMLLVLKRGPDQEAALQDLLEQQQDTSSPNYHKWLTPDQFGQQFGPADADIQTVTSWLTSRGFQSIQVSKGRTVIEFSGTAAQVESALHTSIHQYFVSGENHWANASDPQIPAALAPVVSGVVTLHDFRKKPYLVRSGQTFAITSAPGERPQFRSAGNTNAMGPADFNKIYNVGPGMTGAGATIGVIGRSNINIQDVRDFRFQFGLAVNDPQIVLNGPDPGDLLGNEEGEAVLDVSWSGAVAPLSTVKFVVSESTNATDGIDLSEFYIIDNNLADVMTESFGVCEGAVSANTAAFTSALAEQAAAQGITYLVSSGDNGAAGCDDQTVSPATHAASVNVLASTPFTVAVGGTQFNENGNPGAYWNSSNAPGFLSAQSYIPEDVWNESAGVAGGSGLWSSSGGKSVFFKPKPSWQSGVAGIQADGARDVPDVSLTAAAHDPYLICIAGSCSGGSPSFNGISGTSASVQAFGGVMALVVQKTGARQGQANYVLYKLAAAETLASCNGSAASIPLPGPCTFYDTTVGNNSVPGVTGFTAGVGYDLATGLGSVNVTNLVNKWSTAIVNGTTTVLLLNGGTAVNVTHGTAVPVSIAVTKTAGAGTPTGDVSLIASSATDKGVDGFTLVNGSLPAGTTTTLLPGGTYTVKAHYAGDSNFLASDSTPAVSVTVNPEPSKTAFGIVVGSPCTTGTSVTYGSAYILSAAVTDNTGAGTVCLPAPVGSIPTGTVTLTDTGNTLDGVNTQLSFPLNSLGFFEYQTIQLPAGAHNIKAAYAGDNSFAASNSGPPTLITVLKAATTTSMTSSKNGANVTLTATVDTQSNATANAQQEPNGTVQFLVGGVAFGNPVADTGGVSSTTSFAQATAVLITATLPTGQSNVTAQYSGDTNYSGSTSSGTSVVVGPDFSIVASPLTQTVSAGNSATVKLTITGSSGYAGTINFSASSCSTMPARSSCSFNPPSVTGSGATVLTLSTTSAFLAPQSRPRNVAWPMAGVAALALACILSMLALFVPRRRLLPVSGFLMFACVVLMCGGCKPSPPGIAPGTPAGGYTVTVTATAGGVTHPVTFGITVVP
jgi:hypothetical protein